MFAIAKRNDFFDFSSEPESDEDATACDRIAAEAPSSLNSMQ